MFGKTKAYTSLDSPHSMVHSNVHQALVLSRQDWINDISIRDELLKHLEAAENASTQVIQFVGSMVKEKHG
jgi:hypothetical protein